MSTSLRPSAWEEPRQFSIPAPFERQPGDPALFLASSATHVALGQEDNNRIYLYSLPTFDLHVLELEGNSNLKWLEIYGEILVARGWHGSEEGYSLYFHDLATDKCLGIVIDNFGDATISLPGPESVKTAEKDRLVQEPRPKNRTLVICFADQILQTYKLRRSFNEQGIDNIGIEEQMHEIVSIVPMTTISLGHNVLRHASIGRTAITGGSDATVRVWDLITGEFRRALIGHRSYVIDVCLDTARIYSASTDDTVRIWDRYCGDCLHVLDWTTFPPATIDRLGTTHSYLRGVICTRGSRYCDTLIWDSISGKLVHHIGRHRGDCLGPIRGKEQTLVTLELDEDLGKKWLKIWDVRSGQALTHSPAWPQSVFLKFCSQDRFLMVLAPRSTDSEYMLSVWDFGHNNPRSSHSAGWGSSGESSKTT